MSDGEDGRAGGEGRARRAAGDVGDVDASRAAGEGRATRVWLVRHGESLLNAAGRVQGWADAPLTPAGHALAAARGHEMRRHGVRFAAAVSADGVRHRQTLSALLGVLDGPSPCADDVRWREICFGGFEGTRTTRLQKFLGTRGPDGLDAIAAAPDEQFAETRADVVRRSREALDSLADVDGDVLVVTSGLTIMLLLDALGAELSHVDRGPDHLSVSVLRQDGGSWVVERAVVDQL